MKEITFNKDQVIFRQGEFGAAMYDVLSGEIGIYTDYQGADEKQIAVIKAGEVLGEMGLIEVYPRSATAVVLTDGTVVIELKEDDLRAYLQDKPEKLLQVMRQLSSRIRETTEKYVDVCRAVSDRRRAQSDLNFYADQYSNYWY